MEGPTTGKYMPHCALEFKSRHSKHMTVDFQVLGIFLLLPLPPPKKKNDLGPSKEVFPGTPEFQVLSLPLYIYTSYTNTWKYSISYYCNAVIDHGC